MPRLFLLISIAILHLDIKSFNAVWIGIRASMGTGAAPERLPSSARGLELSLAA